MENSHFSNTGQVLQLIATCVGIVIAGINAYPSIKAVDLLAMWPVIFYILVIIGALTIAFQLHKPSRASDSDRPVRETKRPARILKRLPAQATTIDAETGVFAFKMNIGEQRIFSADINSMKVIAHGIEKFDTGQLYADLTVESIYEFQAGPAAKRKSLNRFLVPVSGTHAESSVFTFRLGDNVMLVDILRVDHINEHAGQIDLVVGRCAGFSS